MSATSSSLNHSFSPLQPGTYDLTITDQNGCIVTQTGIVLNAGPVCCSIIANDNITNATCFGDNGSVTVTTSNTQGAITYQWYESISNTALTGQNNSI